MNHDLRATRILARIRRRRHSGSAATPERRP